MRVLLLLGILLPSACGGGGGATLPALHAIGERGQASAEELVLLEEALDGRDVDRLETALWSAGQVRADELAPRMEALLDHEAVSVRMNAVQAMAALGGEAGHRALIDALADPEGNVVAAALQVLGSAEHGDDWEAVAAVLADGPDVGREVAAQALAEMERPEAWEALCDALGRDPLAEVRSASAFALGRLRAAPAVPCLIEATADETWAVRANAAQSLGSIGAPEAAPVLERLAEDTSESVRMVAEVALEKLR